ncbi:unnamed protein product [Moneuplotes crassus]|uniref:Uncharacterized protein n=1 Tax=Euplotes crassus TaxID=5936 RepID=A0AAD1UHR8_EUPCR|nr:unnamed protein product [Moneuplotes crassus]
MKKGVKDPMLCSYLQCKNPRRYFCTEYKKQVCEECYNILYFDNDKQIIQTSKELELAVDQIFNFVTDLKIRAEASRLTQKIDGLELAFKVIFEEVEAYGMKVRNAIRRDHFTEYEDLIQEASDIKTKILSGAFGCGSDGSNPIFRLFFDLQVLSFSSRSGECKDPVWINRIKRITKKSLHSKASPAANNASIQNENREESKQDEEDIQNLPREANQSAENDTRAQDLISAFEEKLRQKEQELQAEKDKSEGYEQDMNVLKTENDKLNKDNNDLVEEVKQLTEELNQKSESNESVNKKEYEALYEKHMGEKKIFDENCQLRLRMTDTKAQNFIKELGDNKIILPNIDESHTGRIDDSSIEIINRYLLNCIPKSFSKIYLNWEWNEYPIQFSSMIEGLSVALPKITKEVLFNTFVIQSSDLELIMQKCYQTEKIIFAYSKLISSERMNFDTGKGSKLKCLSICSSDFNKQGLSSDFQNHPERLEWIIEALSKSAHKTSLEYINIQDCPIEVKTVEDMLKKYGMDTVVVNVSDENMPPYLL